MKPKLHFNAVALTDMGRQSDHNEDTVFCEVSAQKTAALLIVADGMGGHLAGERASKMVVETIVEAMRPWLDKEDLPPSEQLQEEVQQGLLTAVQQANQAVYSYAEENLAYGVHMGSTVACAFLHQDIAYIANVGDSRVYLYRQEHLQRITEDHSLVERFVQEGIITDQDRFDHDVRNVITRAIGPKSAVAVDLFACDLEAGDCLLLCSDGLWEMLRGEESVYLQNKSDLAERTQNLINAANQAGGEDNISAILAQCLAA